jgi:hypothetical protein
VLDRLVDWSNAAPPVPRAVAPPGQLITMTQLSTPASYWKAGTPPTPTIRSWLEAIVAAFPQTKDYCRREESGDHFEWCGLAVAYCFAINGIEPVFSEKPDDETRFLWAPAWLGWGVEVPTDAPAPGDIVVLAIIPYLTCPIKAYFSSVHEKTAREGILIFRMAV